MKYHLLYPHSPPCQLSLCKFLKETNAMGVACFGSGGMPEATALLLWDITVTLRYFISVSLSLFPAWDSHLGYSNKRDPSWCLSSAQLTLTEAQRVKCRTAAKEHTRDQCDSDGSQDMDSSAPAFLHPLHTAEDRGKRAALSPVHFPDKAYLEKETSGRYIILSA